MLVGLSVVSPSMLLLSLIAVLVVATKSENDGWSRHALLDAVGLVALRSRTRPPRCDGFHACD